MVQVRGFQIRIAALLLLLFVTVAMDGVMCAPGGTTITVTRTGCSENSRSVTLTANTMDSGANTFTWFISDGTSLTGQSVVHTFASTGNFDVRLTSGGQTVMTSISVPVSGESDGGPDPAGDRCVANEGAGHVAEGTQIPYQTNPPASGPHYSGGNNLAPVSPGLYNETLEEERWVHNLEHGYVVVLYDCDGDCEQSFLDDLQTLFESTPVSAFGNRKLVLTRYPGLTPFAMAIAWDVQRDFDSLDQAGILAFYERHVDQGPEFLP